MSMTPYRFGLLHMLPQPDGFDKYLSDEAAIDLAVSVLDRLVELKNGTLRLTEKGKAALKQAAKEPV